jgi:hypothetical protein
MTTHQWTTHTPMNRARDILWTLHFSSAFLSPDVNSRAELLTSPLAYAVGSGIIKLTNTCIYHEFTYLILKAQCQLLSDVIFSTETFKNFLKIWLTMS